MKALLTNWRSYALAVIAIVGLALLLSEPSEDANFMLTILWTKTLGFAALYACFKLSNYWERTGAIDFTSLTNIDDAWE